MEELFQTDYFTRDMHSLTKLLMQKRNYLKVSQAEIMDQIMTPTVMVMHSTTILDPDGLLREGHHQGDLRRPPLIHMAPVDQGKLVYFEIHH